MKKVIATGENTQFRNWTNNFLIIRKHVNTKQPSTPKYIKSIIKMQNT